MGIAARGKAHSGRPVLGGGTVRRPDRWRSGAAALVFAAATVGVGQASLAPAGATADEGGFNSDDARLALEVGQSRRQIVRRRVEPERGDRDAVEVGGRERLQLLVEAAEHVQALARAPGEIGTMSPYPSVKNVSPL